MAGHAKRKGRKMISANCLDATPFPKPFPKPRRAPPLEDLWFHALPPRKLEQMALERIYKRRNDSEPCTFAELAELVGGGNGGSLQRVLKDMAGRGVIVARVEGRVIAVLGSKLTKPPIGQRKPLA